MVDDFQDPEIPKNQREFYMLYFQTMKRNTESFESINKKIDDFTESHADDMDAILKKFDKWDEWKKCHDADLAANLKTLTRHDEKLDQVEKKVNTWSLTNTIAAIGAFITALFMKGS